MTLNCMSSYLQIVRTSLFLLYRVRAKEDNFASTRVPLAELKFGLKAGKVFFLLETKLIFIIYRFFQFVPLEHQTIICICYIALYYAF